MNRILLITTNPGKVQEFQELLPGVDLEHRSTELIEIQSLSTLEIGRYKALEALASLSKEDRNRYQAVLTDDTSLGFEALGGFPGTLVKYCLDALGIDGLLGLLEGKNPVALAGCCLSLGLTQNDNVVQFEGTVEGEIRRPSCVGGFGWDPIFYPLGSRRSFAALAVGEKQKISHRALAANKLLTWLAANPA